MNIVIVEDNAPLLEVVCTVLERAGLVVRGAENVIDGLAAIHELQPDLVLTDLSMPGRSGLSMIRELRENPSTAQLPVVVMTGLLRPAEAKTAPWREELGVAEILCKPLKLRELVPLLTSVVDAPVKPRRKPPSIEPRRPEPATLALLASVWRQGRSGQLDLGDELATICQGRCQTWDDRGRMVRALHLGHAGWTERDVGSLADGPSLGPDLYAAALTLPAAQALDPDAVLVTHAGAHRVVELSLSPALSGLVASARKATATLGDLIEAHGSTLGELAQALSALVRLGVIDQRPGGSAVAGPPRRARPLKAGRVTPTRHRAAAGFDFAMRLKEELLVARQADSWTLLGLEPGASGRAVMRRCDELKEHWGEAALEHEELPDWVLRDALALVKVFDDAAEELIVAGPNESGGTRVGLPLARLRAARVAALARDFEMAARLYRSTLPDHEHDPTVAAEYARCLLADPAADEQQAAEARVLLAPDGDYPSPIQLSS